MREVVMAGKRKKGTANKRKTPRLESGLTRKENKKVNPNKGEKGHFIQTNISLEPELYAQVKTVAMQRRLQGLPDATASAVIREAILYYLEG
jgi:hypothetical protein